MNYFQASNILDQRRAEWLLHVSGGGDAGDAAQFQSLLRTSAGELMRLVTIESATSKPVAAESRFKGHQQWRECTVEHATMVMASPHEWKDYEVRYLYETALMDERKPLTDEQIEAMPLWGHFIGLWPESRKEIVRVIESAHGITATAQKGGE